jgi:hypothetical protein
VTLLFCALINSIAMLQFIFRPVRSIAFVSKSPLRRFSSDADPRTINLVLHKVATITNTFADYRAKYDEVMHHYNIVKCNYEGIDDDFTNLQKELANLRVELTNIRSDFARHKAYLDSFRASFDTRMTSLFGGTFGSQLDEIEREIEDNRIRFFSSRMGRLTKGAAVRKCPAVQDHQRR